MNKVFCVLHSSYSGGGGRSEREGKGSYPRREGAWREVSSDVLDGEGGWKSHRMCLMERAAGSLIGCASCSRAGFVSRGAPSASQGSCTQFIYLFIDLLKAYTYTMPSQPLRVTSGLFTSSNLEHKLNTIQNMHIT